MNTRKSIRAIIAVMTLALIAGVNTQAFGALTSSETPSKSKETLIRVAPVCPSCHPDFDDFG
jgi:hypothetical protein